MTGISPSPPGVPPPAGDAGDPLPRMVMGDAAVALPREHGLRAMLFIGFSYLMAAGSGLGAIILTISASEAGLMPEFGRQALMAGVWAVLQWRLASEVRRFSRWGWYGAMAELCLAAATKLVYTVFLGEMAFVLVLLLMIDGALLRYFWKYRAQFDVDPGG